MGARLVAGPRAGAKGRRIRVAVAALAMVATVLAAEAPGRAAFPGRNGPILCASNRDGNYEIYAFSPDGGEPRRLTNHPARDIEPTMSPDGTRIAFDSTREDPNAEIYVMGADGRAPTRLTTDPAKDFWAAWSRDSSSLAFQSGRGGDQEVYVLRLGGGPPARLTTSPGLDGEPSW